MLVFLLIIACDLASRPPTPSARPRRVYEALPDLRTVAAQQQTEQWTVADAGLAQLRAEQAGRRRGGGARLSRVEFLLSSERISH